MQVPKEEKGSPEPPKPDFGKPETGMHMRCGEGNDTPEHTMLECQRWLKIKAEAEIKIERLTYEEKRSRHHARGEKRVESSSRSSTPGNERKRDNRNSEAD